MDEPRLQFLFRVYFDNSASAEERNELMEWLAETENDEQAKAMLAVTWAQYNNAELLFSEQQGDQMLANIFQQRANREVPSITTYKKNRRWLSVAAGAILLLGITGTVLWVQVKQKSLQVAQSSQPRKPFQEAIVPGGNKASLTLSDGSRIELDSTHVGELAKQGNIKVINLRTSTLAYNSGAGNNQEMVYNTLTTPGGGQYHLLLSDGTSVWLNASSSIHFPAAFSGTERRVAVTGEAYFEVAKHATMPFIITVKDAQVQVLGTHFNIMAYNDEASFNTTLLEGSVKITNGGASKMLVPGQESRIDKTGKIKIEAADVEEVMAWKNGWFEFNAWDIQKVMRQIARWYDIEVAYEGKIPTSHFSGMVSRSNNITQVLKIMQDAGVGFSIEGKKITVRQQP